MSILIIFLSYIVAFLTSLFSKNRNIIAWSSVIGSLVAFIAVLDIAQRTAQEKEFFINDFFSVGSLEALVMLVVSFLGLCAAIYSKSYIAEEVSKDIIGLKRVRQYFALLNLFILMMIGALLSSHPILMWIFIEATTLSTAFLISFYNKPSAMEAAWKYLIINSVGLLLAFFGTLLYFTSFGETTHSAEIISWSDLLKNAGYLDPMVAKIAFVFILIGYGAKIGFVPMHTWKPDAYSKAPTPLVALFSGALLNVAFVAVLKFKIITDVAAGEGFTQNLLIIFGVLSIAFSSLMIFAQKNYKRLLAYSSIEHAGIMALGFGFGGVGVYAAILHMIYHSLAKTALFFAAGNIFLKYSSTKISAVKNMIQKLPKTSVILTLGIFAVVGLPPFGVFFTKIHILSAGMEKHYFVILGVVLFLAVAFAGFLKHLNNMLFNDESEQVQENTKEAGNILVYIPVLLIVILFVLSWWMPSFLKDLINNILLIY